MPPRGNQQLKDHEVELIKYWIDSGAILVKMSSKQEDEELIYNLSSFFPPAPTK